MDRSPPHTTALPSAEALRRQSGAARICLLEQESLRTSPVATSGGWPRLAVVDADKSLI